MPIRGLARMQVGGPTSVVAGVLTRCCTTEVMTKETDEGGVLAWRGWREAVQVMVFPAHLKRTLVTALLVGTILFAINQLNMVIDGHADAGVWVRTGVTYLVPFAVSNVGILIGTRRR